MTITSYIMPQSDTSHFDSVINTANAAIADIDTQLNELNVITTQFYSTDHVGSNNVDTNSINIDLLNVSGDAFEINTSFNIDTLQPNDSDDQFTVHSASPLEQRQQSLTNAINNVRKFTFRLWGQPVRVANVRPRRRTSVANYTTSRRSSTIPPTMKPTVNKNMQSNHVVNNNYSVNNIDFDPDHNNNIHLPAFHELPAELPPADLFTHLPHNKSNGKRRSVPHNYATNKVVRRRTIANDPIQAPSALSINTKSENTNNHKLLLSPTRQSPRRAGITGNIDSIPISLPVPTPITQPARKRAKAISTSSVLPSFNDAIQSNDQPPVLYTTNRRNSDITNNKSKPVPCKTNKLTPAQRKSLIHATAQQSMCTNVDQLSISTTAKQPNKQSAVNRRLSASHAELSKSISRATTPSTNKRRHSLSGIESNHIKPHTKLLIDAATKSNTPIRKLITITARGKRMNGKTKANLSTRLPHSILPSHVVLVDLVVDLNGVIAITITLTISQSDITRPCSPSQAKTTRSMKQSVTTAVDSDMICDIDWIPMLSSITDTNKKLYNDISYIKQQRTTNKSVVFSDAVIHEFYFEPDTSKVPSADTYYAVGMSHIAHASTRLTMGDVVNQRTGAYYFIDEDKRKDIWSNSAYNMNDNVLINNHDKENMIDTSNTDVINNTHTVPTSDIDELNLVRSTRLHTGCSCKGGKNKSLCCPTRNIRGLTTSNNNSFQQTIEHKYVDWAIDNDTPDNSTVDIDSTCECYLAGIPCNGGSCACADDNCKNPALRHTFQQTQINKYRRNIIKSTKQTTFVQ